MVSSAHPLLGSSDFVMFNQLFREHDEHKAIKSICSSKLLDYPFSPPLMVRPLCSGTTTTTVDRDRGGQRHGEHRLRVKRILRRRPLRLERREVRIQAYWLDRFEPASQANEAMPCSTSCGHWGAH